MKKFFTLFTLALLLCTASFAQETAKVKDIRKLLELTKAAESGMAAVKSNLDVMRKTNTSVPPQVWDEFEKAILKEDLLAISVKVYDKNFTHEEIKGLIDFYNTPLGKTFASKMPVVMQESLEAGQAYGQQVAMRVLQKMQAEGKLPAQR